MPWPEPWVFPAPPRYPRLPQRVMHWPSWTPRRVLKYSPEDLVMLADVASFLANPGVKVA